MKRILAGTLLLVAAAVPAQQLAPRLGDFTSQGDFAKPAYAADGSLLVGGVFDRVGNSARRNLVRFAPDGTLDPAWAPNPDGRIRRIVIDAFGNVLVAGDFRTIAGVARPGVARFLSGSPYVLDPDYLPDVPASTSSINDLALRSDGTAYVSYCQRDTPTVCRIVRLDAQGAAVSGFDASTNGASFPMVLSQDEQSLLIAGNASMVGGLAVPSRGNLARLDANTGAMSAAWIPFATGSGSIRAIIPDGPGHMLVAGQIPGGADGLARVALADPGTADTGFGPDVGPAATVLMTELLRMPDDDLVISGNFLLIDGQARASRVARLAPDGTLRPDWGAAAPAGGTASNSMAVSATGRVAKPSLAVAGGVPQSSLYELSAADGSDLGRLVAASFAASATFLRLVREPVSGRIFAGAGGLEAINGRNCHPVFALQANLQPDLAWTSMLGSKVRLGGSLSMSSGPTALILGASGFGTNSLQTFGLYRLNAADGSNNDWLPQAAPGVGLGINPPTAVAVDEAGGYVYVTGINTDANGAPIGGGTLRRYALADGLRDSTWSSTLTLGAGLPPMLVADGFVYLGNVNAATATDDSIVIGLARFSVSGSGRADPTFAPFQSITNLQAMAQDAGHIYVGGLTTLARINKQTGLVDPDWRPNIITNVGTVNSIAVADDGTVFLAGSINLGCGGAAVSVARIQAGGRLDPIWRIELDAQANAVLPLPPADALVAGGFRTANGAAHDGLVRVGRSETVFVDGLGDPGCVRPAP